jgi:tetratricopeptide (TPR) repeat protein
MDYVNAAIACLELGDEKTYLRVREEMATRFKDADEVAPWRSLEVGLLRPVDDTVAPTFNNFAAGLAVWSRNETNDHWGLMLLSLHSYRNGDYARAMDLARQSLARVPYGVQLPNAELSIILALSLNQLGNRSAALSELDRAESVLRTGFDLEYDVWHWRHWVGVRLLLQEARGLISHAPSPQSNAAPR